jgi:dTDP-4-dehydrorhamnose 3,5-epimerase
MTDVAALEIPDVKLITLRKFADHRGFFSEVFNARQLREHGIDTPFVQDNHSLSVSPGTVRGLHFQTPPHAQGKLIRVLRGRIFDVAVDLRRGSPTYGRHVSIELSADDWTLLWIPPGFAHGFCTLEPQTEVFYKTTEYYAPQSDAGILWNDPGLGISWPASAADAVVSEKDARLPRLEACEPPFAWGEASAFSQRRRQSGEVGR